MNALVRMLAAGTLIGAAQRGNLLDSHGRLPRLGRALDADLVVMVEIDSVAVTEPQPNRERRAVRTRSGADTFSCSLVIGMPEVLLAMMQLLPTSASSRTPPSRSTRPLPPHPP